MKIVIPKHLQGLVEDLKKEFNTDSASRAIIEALLTRKQD